MSTRAKFLRCVKKDGFVPHSAGFQAQKRTSPDIRNAKDLMVTCLAGSNPCSGSPNVHSPHKSRIQERLKRNRQDSRSCISALGQSCRQIFLAGVRAAVPLRAPSCFAPAAHWPLEGQLCQGNSPDYLQGRRLSRPILSGLGPSPC